MGVLQFSVLRGAVEVQVMTDMELRPVATEN